MAPTIDTKLCLFNEAHILGHCEAKTPAQRAAATKLVGEGLLKLGGTMSSPRGAKWYKPAYTPSGHAMPTSPRVRFTHPGPLGASTADDLCHTVTDTYGVGDGGLLAFQHPNPKLAEEGWIYVEVASKTGPARKLYVGVPLAWIEAV